MTRTSSAIHACIVSSILCGVSYGTFVEGQRDPSSEWLATVSYWIFYPGEFVARQFSPESDNGNHLYPLGMVFCFLIYFLLAYLFVRSSRMRTR